MKRTPLQHVQRLIQKLSPEDRRSLFRFLAEFPDSGVQTYDPSGELEPLDGTDNR